MNNKYLGILALSLALSLSATACSNEVDEQETLVTKITEDSLGYELTEEIETAPTPDPDQTAPYNENVEQAVKSQEELSSVIASVAEGTLIDSFYADFNNNGTYELYASYRPDGVADPYADILWYTDGIDCTCVSEDSGMSGYLFDSTNNNYAFIYTSGLTMGYGIPVYTMYTVSDDNTALTVDMSVFDDVGAGLRFSMGNFYYWDNGFSADDSVTDSPLYPIIWNGSSFEDTPTFDLSISAVTALDVNSVISIQGNITEEFQRGDNILHINYTTFGEGEHRSMSYKIVDGVVTEPITTFEDSVIPYGYYNTYEVMHTVF